MASIACLPIDPYLDLQILTAIWNQACAPDFAARAEFFSYNLQPVTGGAQAGMLALADGTPAGFAFASTLRGQPQAHPPQTGFLDCLAVHPHFQRQGIGRALLDWAESWLKEAGCTQVRSLGSIRTFAAGVPAALQGKDFFIKAGFNVSGEVWDVARDLGDGAPISRRPMGDPGAIRPAEDADLPAMLVFFERTFPGRWKFEFVEYLKNGGRIADFMILALEQRVEGFCWLTFGDSLRPLDRYYMHRLPLPWGQLGPIGVSQEVRSQGWGGLLLQAGLERLHSRGVRGCVIDWTHLLDFYGKYGFRPYTRYLVMVKSIG